MPERPLIAFLSSQSLPEAELISGTEEVLPLLRKWRTIMINPQVARVAAAMKFLGVRGFVGVTLSPEVLEAAREAQVPGVLAIRSDPRGRFPAVVHDDVQIGKLGALHLLDRGHRELGFLCLEPDENPWAASREAGFVEAVRRAGVTPRLSREVIGDLNWTRAHASTDIDRWLSTLARPAAVMAPNDLLASLLLDATRRVGLDVPRDVAVLGVDNHQITCESALVPLSSVTTNMPAVVARAMRRLDELMRGRRVPPITLVPPGGVVVERVSTRPASVDPVLSAALQMIEADDAAGLTVAGIARELGLSRSQLEKRFIRRLGVTPAERLRTLRLDRARDLLLRTHLPLADIAVRCGFADQPAFTKAFRQRVGATPARFRKAHAMLPPQA